MRGTDGPSLASLPIGYTGHYWDRETGLWYARNRYYDDRQGRFLRRDPLGYSASMALYEYSGSSPVMYVDLLGLDKYYPGQGIGGGTNDPSRPGFDPKKPIGPGGPIGGWIPGQPPCSGYAPVCEGENPGGGNYSRDEDGDGLSEVSKDDYDRIAAVCGAEGGAACEWLNTMEPAGDGPTDDIDGPSQAVVIVWGEDPYKPKGGASNYGGGLDIAWWKQFELEGKKIDKEIGKFAELNCSLAFGSCSMFFTVLNAEIEGPEGVTLAAIATGRARPLAQRLAYLYQKLSAAGEHLKFGITSNPQTRYSASQLAGGELRILAEGNRKEMLALERKLHETLPLGPEEKQLFYVTTQVENGLKPPPY